MEPTFRPTPGAKGYQHSCTPVFSSIPLLATLELIEKAGFDAMRSKGIRLTDTLEDLLKASKFYISPGRERSLGFRILTPPPPWRGTQLSLFVVGDEGVMPRVFSRCLARGLVGDERHPNVIRLSPVVLYNTYQEVGRAVEILEKALEEEEQAVNGDKMDVKERDVLSAQKAYASLHLGKQRGVKEGGNEEDRAGR
jgi:kynureninase